MELPLRKAILDLTNDELGLEVISLVGEPAIEINLITMANQERVKLSFQDEVKRIIFTPVLIPNQKIYRKIKLEDGTTEEFNLFFDAETIEKIAVKWAKDNLLSTVDIEHSRKLIDGVTFFESVVLNQNRFSEAKGFEGLPLGTWMLAGIVENDEVADKIKNGEINGVSIDGLFKTVSVKASNELDIDTILKNISKCKL